MQKLYDQFEKKFEKASETATLILGHPISFIIVLCAVLAWIVLIFTGDESAKEKMGDCFIGISFICLFLVQRTINKTSLALRVKINELVKVHDKASNDVINLEQKTHKEIDEISKEMHS